MRIIFLLLALLIFGILITFQLKLFQSTVAPTLSPESSTNVNTQLDHMQKKVDNYEQQYEQFQNEAEDALKTLDK